MKKYIKRSLYALMGILVALVVVSEGFIGYALKPQLKERETGAWVDSVMRCGALRDTFIVSKETGDSLHGWYLRADSVTKNVAVLVHGYTDNALMMGKIAEIYDRSLKYNILLPDLHYHGQSQGTYVQMGWKDRKDVLQWCEVADSLFGGETKQVLHGVSMGAATVMCVSGEELPKYISCFVEDCGYTSVWDEFENEMANQFGLPSFPLLNIISMVNKVHNGWSFQEASPLEQVKKCQKPMLFIHGGADDFVKTEMVYRLYEAKQGEKQIKVFPGVKHAKSYDENKEEYTKLVVEFVDRYNR